MKQFQCPTCERAMRRPSHWLHPSVIWICNLFTGTFFALWILYPPEVVFSECVKGAEAGGGSLSSCYGPQETWLALGWIMLFAFWSLVFWIIRAGIIENCRSRARWIRVLPRLEEVAH